MTYMLLCSLAIHTDKRDGVTKTFLMGELTISMPNLGQVAAAFSWLLTELHHITTRRLWSDGHLRQRLLPITQIHH